MPAHHRFEARSPATASRNNIRGGTECRNRCTFRTIGNVTNAGGKSSGHRQWILLADVYRSAILHSFCLAAMVASGITQLFLGMTLSCQQFSWLPTASLPSSWIPRSLYASLPRVSPKRRPTTRHQLLI